MTKQIVILGSSWLGLGVAHKLLKRTLPKTKDFKVIIISPSTHMYWNIAAPRAIVPGALADDEFMKPYADGFARYSKDHYEIIQAKAESVDFKTKTVQTNLRPVKYDILVIATGSSTSDHLPMKLIGSHEDTLKSLHVVQDKIAAAKTIVVGGGGATGTETAAELGFEYRKIKDIYLITSTERLLPIARKDVGADAKTELEKLHVKVKTGTKILSTESLGSQTKVTLSTGEPIIADVYLPTVGLHANTSFLPQTLLAENGDIKVDPYFHVGGQTDVFAAGDAANIAPKSVLNTDPQVAHLAANLELILTGHEDKLAAYKPSETLMLAATTGRSRAVGIGGNWRIPSLFIWFLKGRNMLLGELPKLIAGAKA
jgi:NADH dehydrogenase FAD-containing subunit